MAAIRSESRSKSYRGSVIFDGDDTLWSTQFVYERAKERFYSLMSQQGFARERTEDMLANIDVANVSKLGFSKHRFPLSMRETYERLSDERGQPVDRQVSQAASEVGYSVFQHKPRLLEGVVSTLLTLARRGYDCYLYTAGDQEVQTRKLEALNISSYFKAVYITESKSAEVLSSIIRELGLEAKKTWMVGNSLRSDINPALKLGLNCVWIRSLSWAYDHEPLIGRQVIQTDDLRELPCLLETQSATKQIP